MERHLGKLSSTENSYMFHVHSCSDILYLFNFILYISRYSLFMKKRILNRKRLRKKWYNYASAWYYFITICTKHRAHYFGEIENGEMKLNRLWLDTWKCRKNICKHHPYAEPWTFICMPNHIHWIITITNNPKYDNRSVGTKYFSSGNDNLRGMSNNSSLPDQSYKRYPNQWYGAPSGSIWSIVRWFKIGVTQFANQNDIIFSRQTSYHDHIIRNKQSYENIQRYIINNPKNRKEDTFS